MFFVLQLCSVKTRLWLHCESWNNFRTLEGQKAISPIWQDLVPTTLIAPSHLCSSCRLPLLPLLPGCSLQWREPSALHFRVRQTEQRHIFSVSVKSTVLFFEGYSNKVRILDHPLWSDNRGYSFCNSSASAFLKHGSSRFLYYIYIMQYQYNWYIIY